jgi:single-strand DNA-binding protein
MASLNKVYLVGNLTKDPEIRFVPSGQAVCNLRMATNRKYKDGKGEWKEEVTFVGVEVWGKSAEACGEYLKKGSPLLVEGRLKLKEWTAQDGQKRSMIEVVSERVQFLGKKDELPAGSGQDQADPPAPTDTPPPAGDDDIPF